MTAGLGALALAQSSLARKDLDDLRYLRLTKPQLEFVSCPAREAAWVDGNQLGKSTALAFDVLHRCRGTHPFVRVKSPPIKVLVIGFSFEQMEPLMEKLWTFAPKSELHPKCGYDPGRGITGKPPRLVFSSGPGRGSRILFATYKQGAGRVAGSTLDGAVMDEPPPESIYEEVVPRLLRLGGWLRIGMTPVPGMPDVTWLREKCEGTKDTPKSTELFQFGLSPENCWPEDYPQPWLNQTDIDAFAAKLSPRVRRMRTRGAWEQIAEGGMLSAFDRNKHVRRIDLGDLIGWKLVVGLDHGTHDGKQCAMLAAVSGGNTARPRVRYLEEEVSDGFTTPEHDAQAVIDMLRRRGLTYDDVNVWIGDVSTGSQRFGIKKSNKLVRRELARLIGREQWRLKEFKEPVKYKSSMTDGCDLMNTFLDRVDEDGVPHALVDEACPTFAEACEKFDGGKWHPLKDVLDAGRYATEAAVGDAARPILSSRY